MTTRKIINTPKAPAAIGTYSQAVLVDNTAYISGQIPLDPDTMELVVAHGEFSEIEAQITQVFKNLQAICQAAGAELEDIVKLNIYLTDLKCFPCVNKIMSEFFSEPYPARAAIEVSALPKGANVEMDAVMVVPSA